MIEVARVGQDFFRNVAVVLRVEPRPGVTHGSPPGPAATPRARARSGTAAKGRCRGDARVATPRSVGAPACGTDPRAAARRGTLPTTWDRPPALAGCGCRAKGPPRGGVTAQKTEWPPRPPGPAAAPRLPAPDRKSVV